MSTPSQAESMTLTRAAGPEWVRVLLRPMEGRATDAGRELFWLALWVRRSWLWERATDTGAPNGSSYICITEKDLRFHHVPWRVSAIGVLGYPQAIDHFATDLPIDVTCEVRLDLPTDLTDPHLCELRGRIESGSIRLTNAATVLPDSGAFFEAIWPPDHGRVTGLFLTRSRFLIEVAPPKGNHIRLEYIGQGRRCRRIIWRMERCAGDSGIQDPGERLSERLKAVQIRAERAGIQVVIHPREAGIYFDVFDKVPGKKDRGLREWVRPGVQLIFPAPKNEDPMIWSPGTLLEEQTTPKTGGAGPAARGPLPVGPLSLVDFDAVDLLLSDKDIPSVPSDGYDADVRLYDETGSSTQIEAMRPLYFSAVDGREGVASDQVWQLVKPAVAKRDLPPAWLRLRVVDQGRSPDPIGTKGNERLTGLRGGPAWFEAPFPGSVASWSFAVDVPAKARYSTAEEPMERLRLLLDSSGVSLKAVSAEVVATSPQIRLPEGPVLDPNGVPADQMLPLVPGRLRFRNDGTLEQAPGPLTLTLDKKLGTGVFSCDYGIATAYLGSCRSLIDPAPVSKGNLRPTPVLAAPVIESLILQASVPPGATDVILEAGGEHCRLRRADVDDDLLAGLWLQLRDVTLPGGRLLIRIEGSALVDSLIYLRLESPLSDTTEISQGASASVGTVRPMLPRDPNHGLVPLTLRKFGLSFLVQENALPDLSVAYENVSVEQISSVPALCPWVAWTPCPDDALADGSIVCQDRMLIQEHAELLSAYGDRFGADALAEEVPPSAALGLLATLRAVRGRYGALSGNLLLGKQDLRNWRDGIELQDSDDKTITPEIEWREKNDQGVPELVLSWVSDSSGAVPSEQTLSISSTTSNWLEYDMKPLPWTGDKPRLQVYDIDVAEEGCLRSVNGANLLQFDPDGASRYVDQLAVMRNVPRAPSGDWLSEPVLWADQRRRSITGRRELVNSEEANISLVCEQLLVGNESGTLPQMRHHNARSNLGVYGFFSDLDGDDLPPGSPFAVLNNWIRIRDMVFAVVGAERIDPNEASEVVFTTVMVNPEIIARKIAPGSSREQELQIFIAESRARRALVRVEVKDSRVSTVAGSFHWRFSLSEQDRRPADGARVRLTRLSGDVGWPGRDSQPTFCSREIELESLGGSWTLALEVGLSPPEDLVAPHFGLQSTLSGEKDRFLRVDSRDGLSYLRLPFDFGIQIAGAGITGTAGSRKDDSESTGLFLEYGSGRELTFAIVQGGFYCFLVDAEEAVAGWHGPEALVLWVDAAGPGAMLVREDRMKTCVEVQGPLSDTAQVLEGDALVTGIFAARKNALQSHQAVLGLDATSNSVGSHFDRARVHLDDQLVAFDRPGAAATGSQVRVTGTLMLHEGDGQIQVPVRFKVGSVTLDHKLVLALELPDSLVHPRAVLAPSDVTRPDIVMPIDGGSRVFTLLDTSPEAESNKCFARIRVTDEGFRLPIAEECVPLDLCMEPEAVRELPLMAPSDPRVIHRTGPAALHRPRIGSDLNEVRAAGAGSAGLQARRTEDFVLDSKKWMGRPILHDGGRVRLIDHRLLLVEQEQVQGQGPAQEQSPAQEQDPVQGQGPEQPWNADGQLAQVEDLVTEGLLVLNPPVGEKPSLLSGSGTPAPMLSSAYDISQRSRVSLTDTTGSLSSALTPQEVERRLTETGSYGIALIRHARGTAKSRFRFVESPFFRHAGEALGDRPIERVARAQLDDEDPAIPIEQDFRLLPPERAARLNFESANERDPLAARASLVPMPMERDPLREDPCAPKRALKLRRVETAELFSPLVPGLRLHEPVTYEDAEPLWFGPERGPVREENDRFFVPSKGGIDYGADKPGAVQAHLAQIALYDEDNGERKVLGGLTDVALREPQQIRVDRVQLPESEKRPADASKARDAKPSTSASPLCIGAGIRVDDLTIESDQAEKGVARIEMEWTEALSALPLPEIAASVEFRRKGDDAFEFVGIPMTLAVLVNQELQAISPDDDFLPIVEVAANPTAEAKKYQLPPVMLLVGKDKEMLKERREPEAGSLLFRPFMQILKAGSDNAELSFKNGDRGIPLIDTKGEHRLEEGDWVVLSGFKEKLEEGGEIASPVNGIWQVRPIEDPNGEAPSKFKLRDYRSDGNPGGSEPTGTGTWVYPGWPLADAFTEPAGTGADHSIAQLKRGFTGGNGINRIAWDETTVTAFDIRWWTVENGEARFVSLLGHPKSLLYIQPAALYPRLAAVLRAEDDTPTPREPAGDYLYSGSPEPESAAVVTPERFERTLLFGEAAATDDSDFIVLKPDNDARLVCLAPENREVLRAPLPEWVKNDQQVKLYMVKYLPKGQVVFSRKQIDRGEG